VPGSVSVYVLDRRAWRRTGPPTHAQVELSLTQHDVVQQPVLASFTFLSSWAFQLSSIHLDAFDGGVPQSGVQGPVEVLPAAPVVPPASAAPAVPVAPPMLPPFPPTPAVPLPAAPPNPLPAAPPVPSLPPAPVVPPEAVVPPLPRDPPVATRCWRNSRRRAIKALERRGVVRVCPEALEVDDALSDRDPVLAQLAAAAVAGFPPAGPAERKREPVALVTDSGPEIVGDLVVQDCGFNLHAKTRAGAVDDEARAAFCAPSCALRLRTTASPSYLTTVSG